MWRCLFVLPPLGIQALWEHRVYRCASPPSTHAVYPTVAVDVAMRLIVPTLRSWLRQCSPGFVLHSEVSHDAPDIDEDRPPG